jgi:ParB family chromosome partitioning protein
MRHDIHYVEELVKTSRSIGRIIPIDNIEPNPEQPRTEIGDLTELVNSIREKGVLEPLLVKPLSSSKWLIIAGERRWRAAGIAGLKEVPCIELDIDEMQVAEIALIENLQRKDLTVWEEADALAALCRRFNYTHEDLARKIGKSRSSVTESLSIAALPPIVRERSVRAGINSKSQILQIARQFDEEAMLEAIENKANNSQVPQENGSANLVKLSPKTERIMSESLSDQQEAANEKKFPLRVYTYKGEEEKFKIEVKFKRPSQKDQLLDALKEVIENLQK